MTAGPSSDAAGAWPAPWEVCEAGLEHAVRLAGVRGCAVLVEDTSWSGLRWAANTLVEAQTLQGREVTVVVVTDHPSTPGAAGVAALTRRIDQLGDAGALVEDAVLAAHALDPVGEAPALVGGGPSGIWQQPPEPVTGRSLAAVVPALGEALRRSAAHGREWHGRLVQERAITWMATSEGLRLRHEQPSAWVEVTALSHDRERSTWTGRAARQVTELDPPALERGLALRLDWQARRVDLPEGRYPVVLAPECVADLMVRLYVAADVASAARGHGPFARATGGSRVGERLTELPLTVRSDPQERGLECAPVVLARADSPVASVLDNGLPVGPQRWVQDGVLQGLHSTRTSAAATGAAVRPAPGNLVVEVAGAATGRGPEDLAADLDRGLLATSVWGVHDVDPATLTLGGVLRDGLYVVDGGEIVGTLGDRAFTESPLGMLDRVVRAGDTRPALGRDWGRSFSRTAAPTLLVDGLQLGGRGPGRAGVP